MRLEKHFAVAMIGSSVAIAMLCPTARATAQRSPAGWAISDAALLSIGVAGGDSTKEFHRVEGALRLSDGRIVVADAGSSRLRWFGTTGEHVRSVGRRGQGPEEFSRYMVALAGAGDTVLVHDPFGKRMHYFTGAGDFVRLEAGAVTSRALSVYDRSLIMPLPATVDARQVRAALVRIPFEPSTPLRVVRVDESGNLWIRGVTEPKEFSIYDGEGRGIGSLAAPPHFDVMQMFDTLVLGRFRDGDGVEHVQLRRLWRPTPTLLDRAETGRIAYDPAAELAAAQSIIRPLRALGRIINTMQADHAARHGRYATSLDGLGMPRRDPTTGVLSSLLMVDEASYWVIAEHPSTRIICIQAIGATVPLGYFSACG